MSSERFKELQVRIERDEEMRGFPYTLENEWPDEKSKMENKIQKY